MKSHSKRYETALIMGDWQVPFQDDKALKLVFRLAADIQPDRIFLNGDIVDCFSLSTFDKDPENSLGSFKNEIATARKLLKELRTLCPKSKITYIFGNHEYRLKRYLMREARELYGFVTLKDLLFLDDLKIEVVDSGHRESFTEYGNLLIGHFDIARSHSGQTAKSLVDRFHQSVVQSHTHRLGLFFKTTNREELVGAECGCLCKKGEYQIIPNWQQGALVIKKDLLKGNDFFNMIHIRDHSLFYNNKIYK